MLVAVTVALPLVVAAPVTEALAARTAATVVPGTTPVAVRESAEPVASAGELRVNEVPLTTEATVAPAGMPVPVMG